VSVPDGIDRVIVRDGAPIERNLRRERITVEEVQATALGTQIASLADVRFGVLETDGTISFIAHER
jgi:uncharacterized membrane protein YcaP (DUF421 family)